MITATDAVQENPTEILQVTLNNINQWLQDWNIKLNRVKYIHVSYTLHYRYRIATNVYDYIAYMEG